MTVLELLLSLFMFSPCYQVIYGQSCAQGTWVETTDIEVNVGSVLTPLSGGTTCQQQCEGDIDCVTYDIKTNAPVTLQCYTQSDNLNPVFAVTPGVNHYQFEATCTTAVVSVCTYVYIGEFVFDVTDTVNTQVVAGVADETACLLLCLRRTNCYSATFKAGEDCHLADTSTIAIGTRIASIGRRQFHRPDSCSAAKITAPPTTTTPPTTTAPPTTTTIAPPASTTTTIAPTTTVIMTLSSTSMLAPTTSSEWRRPPTTASAFPVPSTTDYSPRPNVSVTPTKGPQAGGTNITLTGSTDIRAVFLYDGKTYKECSILTREASVVIAQTPSHNKSESLQIRIQLDDGSWIEGPMFAYKANPTIKDIRPQVSLVGGSTRLTVSGKSLDSVAEPKIKYGVENCTKATRTDEFIKVCEVETADQMICLTPDLRQCTLHISKQGETGIPKRNIGTSDQQADYNEVQFYLEIIGFVLDGDDSYTDFSSTELSHLGELRVYGQPIMYESKEIIKYKKGVPLQIKGQDLLRGNTKEDFLVHVGAEVCHVTMVTDSNLQCMPPDPVPLKAEYSTSKYHSIIVYLGNYIHEYGELQYPDPLLLPLAVGVPLFVLVVIAITTAALLIHRRNKQNKRRHQREQQRALQGHNNDRIELPPIHCEWNDKRPIKRASTGDGDAMELAVHYIQPHEELIYTNPTSE